MGTFFRTAMQLVQQEKERRGSFRALCEPLDLNATTVQKWFTEKKGGEPRAPGIDQIGKILDSMGVQLIAPGENFRDFALVPKTTAKAGAGSSFEIEDQTEGLYAFRADYLGQRHISEAHAVLVEVSGDSMDPTLKSGDTILVDKSDTDVMDGHIYLVGFQGQLLVKRVSRTVTGLRLKSDNPVFSDIDIPREYMDDFIVFGRMRWMSRNF